MTARDPLQPLIDYYQGQKARHRKRNWPRLRDARTQQLKRETGYRRRRKPA